MAGAGLTAGASAAQVSTPRMHTTTTLRSADFEIIADGRRGAIETLLPGFTEQDRLGIVVTGDRAAAGASTLILAAVTAFYDRLRMAGTPFFAYADYFTFALGRPRGSHAKLEIFPSHKEVVVAEDPEQILRAINDRAITRLLVPDGPPGAPVFAPETLDSARRRIRTALLYSPTGRVTAPDVSITGTEVTESYVSALLAPDPAMCDARRRLLEDGRPTETFGRIEVQDALLRLGARQT
jgi:hypothetical protein